MSFKGMDPEAGRNVAKQIQQAGQKIEHIFQELKTAAHGTDWVGPDADHFKSDFDGFMNGTGKHLSDAFTKKGTELQKQAEEQDQTSNNNG